MNDTSPPLSAHDWQQRVRELERRGEFLHAYDVALQGLDVYPDDLWLRYRAVLVIARAGATRVAEQKYREWGLSDVQHEDVAALGARLAKDAALSAPGDTRAELAARSAVQYEAVYRRTEGYFPGINASTMWLLAGRTDTAEMLAARVLQDLDRLPTAAGEDAYYRAATRAEACLVLKDIRGADTALREAGRLVGGDLAAQATTRKQLRLVCSLNALDSAVLDGFETPSVLHYCGHMISRPGQAGRFPASLEATVASSIRAHLQQRPVGFGYGSLAAGGDLLFAEALLASGAELHVVLPFRRDEFVEMSVRPAGTAWIQRFARCLGRARSVRYATEDSYLGDDSLFQYCSGLAMGLAVLHARYLDAGVEQVAVWDGRPGRTVAGTGADVAFWRTLGLPQTILSIEPTGDAGSITGAAPGETASRVRRAMLFGDVKGFSRLNDRELPAFIEFVLEPLAAAVDGFAGSLTFRNTWGDGIFLVFEDPRVAARCALSLQRTMRSIDLGANGLPPHLALRLGGHFGPVYRTRDPVLKVENYFGAHVTRAARIEPVTPEGSVYVTEPFAAMLALDVSREFDCDYVGHQAGAKNYTALPMYLLRPRGAAIAKPA